MVMIHLRRNPTSCSVNNYFTDSLEAWKTSRDIQPVFNEKKNSCFDHLKYQLVMIHLRQTPTSCSVNNYFKNWLEAWEANMDIQLVFNGKKAVAVAAAVSRKILVPALWNKLFRYPLKIIIVIMNKWSSQHVVILEFDNLLCKKHYITAYQKFFHV